MTHTPYTTYVPINGQNQAYAIHTIPCYTLSRPIQASSRPSRAISGPCQACVTAISGHYRPLPGPYQALTRPLPGPYRPYPGPYRPLYGPSRPLSGPCTALIRPIQALIRPFKALVRPFKALTRPLQALVRPFKALIRPLYGPYTAYQGPCKALVTAYTGPCQGCIWSLPGLAKAIWHTPKPSKMAETAKTGMAPYGAVCSSAKESSPLRMGVITGRFLAICAKWPVLPKNGKNGKMIKNRQNRPKPISDRSMIDTWMSSMANIDTYSPTYTYICIYVTDLCPYPPYIIFGVRTPYACTCTIHTCKGDSRHL